MKKIILSISLLLIVASASFAQKVNVAAAANLRYVLEEIKNEYQKEHPNSKINLTFSSSGNLVQQILNGA